ncbi:hypothetical protein [Marininema halotolerans]|uniref:Phage holin family Hol44, holin superfamily V n=1 Tax=Marininema halotolerans TaxID=1155944 RepID=A0A1I6QMX6_9BACL|nr:hypothetical protein [Marininema halotolerans]SFS53807.1 hypothetical protein SAMN05444972_103259 [Marininema halotolerans]
MNEQVFGVALVPLIMGLVEMAKLWGLPVKWAALLAVVMGLVAGVFIVAPDHWVQGVVVGLAMGLSATGLYSGTKNIHEDITMRRMKYKKKKSAKHHHHPHKTDG